LRDRRQVRQKKHVSTARLIISIVVIVVFAAGTVAGDTKTGERIADAAQRFLTFYSGVFALVALTGAVVAGLAATDRIVMSAGHRIVGQAVHRAMAFIAVAFLVTHIAMEVVVGKSNAIDSVVPFLAHGKTFYVGLGTIASDLIILIAATGIARRRFAEKSSPFVWRILHGSAYLAWPLSIVHGLVAGRHPKPYVSWSYGACLLAVGLALVLRSVATVRPRQATAQAWPQHTGSPAPAAASAAAHAYLLNSQRAAAMAGISPGVPAGGMPVLPGAVAHTPAGGMPVAPGSQYYTPAGGMPVLPGAVAHTPASGMPVAPGNAAHTPAGGMQAPQAMQGHAPPGGAPRAANSSHRAPAGGMGPEGLRPEGMGPEEMRPEGMWPVPGTQYQAPPGWMPAAPEMEPPAEYAAVPYRVQALYPAPPDDQAGWAAR
jgi:DMSO/TMAO reductase YedYZ heme-binding membrane subunit